MNNLMTRPLFGIATLALLVASATAAPIVTMPSYSVPAGTAVVIPITVSNLTPAATADIEGMTFTFQVAGGTGTVPRVTSVDLLTGTIWAGHVTPPSVFTPAGGNAPQYQSRDLLTDSPGDFVDANGLLATVTVDTTGATSGDYALKLIATKTAGRDSAFLDGFGSTVTATFPSSSMLSVTVPEPSFLASLVTVAIGCGVARRRFQGVIVERGGQPVVQDQIRYWCP